MAQKCIIIGAGASYGYDSNMIDEEKPPLGKDVLRRAVEIGALTEWKYPMISSTLTDYANKFTKDSEKFSDIDIEEYLEYLADQLVEIYTKIDSNNPPHTKEQLDTVLSKFQNDFEGTWRKIKNEIQSNPDPYFNIKNIASKLQSAIGESWYLMFEVFKKYSLAYRPNLDAYQRLVLSHIRDDYNVVSLNYDVLFEMAAIASGMIFQYPPENSSIVNNFQLVDPRKIIKIAKVHGSINWLNSYSRGISLGSGKERGYRLMRIVSGLIYTNRVKMEPIVTINPLQLQQIDIQDILLSGTKYYEPALLPPVGKYKDYQKVKYFESNWKAAEGYVKSSDELVFIGTSIRDQDTKLKDMIEMNVTKSVKITIVGSQEAETKIRKILGNKISDLCFYCNFEEYAKQL